jgi:hypothetical protein
VHVKGLKKPDVFFQSGLVSKLDLKVLSPLKKPLFSVAKMNKSFRVVLDGPEASYAEHRKTGERIRIYLKQGIFVMPVWVRRNSFGRQALVEP